MGRLDEIQTRVDETCARYGVAGRAAMTENNTVVVIIEGDIRRATQTEMEAIRDAIEAIEGIDRVVWDITPRR